MGFDFTVIVPLLPSHCGFFFVFGCGVSFLVSSSVFLLMIVQQIVVILVFSQRRSESMSFYSTILVPPAVYILKRNLSGLHGPGSMQDAGHCEMCKGYKDNFVSATTFKKVCFPIQPSIHPTIHASSCHSAYFLNAYCVSETLFDARHTKTNKTDIISSFLDLIIYQRGKAAKEDIIIKYKYDDRGRGEC